MLVDGRGDLAGQYSQLCLYVMLAGLAGGSLLLGCSLQADGSVSQRLTSVQLMQLHGQVTL